MRATTKVRALPEESWDPALWSIAAAFSLAVVYLARLSQIQFPCAPPSMRFDCSRRSRLIWISLATWAFDENA